MDELLIDSSQADGAIRLTLDGEVDMATAPQFRDALEQAQRSGLPIEIDMAAVTFMDSAGINVLIDAAKSCEGTASALRVGTRSEAVRQVLEITGLAGVFAPPD